MAVAIALGLTVPAAASAAIDDDHDWSTGTIARSATIATVGDDALPAGVARVTSVAVAQDLEARIVTATVTFASPPVAGSDSVTYVHFGTSSYSKGCTGEFVVAGAGANGSTAGAFTSEASSTPHAVTRAASANTVTLTSAPHDAIRTNDWDCAFASVRSPDGATRYQSFLAADLVPREVPVLQVSSDDLMQGAYAGAWTKVSVDVRNRGEIEAPNVTVSLSGAGLAFRHRTRSLGTIQKRTTKYRQTFLVKLPSAKARTLIVRASAPGARSDEASIRIVRRPAPKIAKSLVGTAFWGAETSNLSDSTGWNTHGVYFVNRAYAYLGFAKAGVVPRCRVTTKECKPYTYNARTGVVSLAGQRFKVTSEGFERKVGKPLEKVHFAPLTLPKPGTKFAAKLVHQNWSGVCLIQCTSTTRLIEFARDGRFVKSSSSIGSWPGLGSSWAIIPADQRGTWRVIRTGVLELKYADGKVELEGIGFDQNLLGRPDPVNEGLLLGGTPYYQG